MSALGGKQTLTLKMFVIHGVAMRVVCFWAFVLLQACASPHAVPMAASLRVTNDNHGCLVMLSAQPFRLPSDEQRLEDAFRRLAQGNAQVLVEADNTLVPFKCVGYVVFLMQKVGLKSGFVAEPPPPR